MFSRGIVNQSTRNDALENRVEHVPLFLGNLYYVDAAQADDTGDGTTPETAKQSIGAAIALLAAGDAILVKAGTYAEAVALNVNACEMWCEIGTIIAPGAGTGLTVSGNYCKVWCPGGAIRVNPVAAGTGVVASGNFCYLHDLRVNCASSANLGFDVTGDGCVLTNCRCADPLVAAFKVQGDKCKLTDCCTGGQIADTSIGFWVTNNADQFRIDDSASQGHSSGGFIIDTGCTNGCVRGCSSGVGDGRWQDGDHVVAFTDWHYDDDENKIVTFAGAPTTYNLFMVTGAVQIMELYGIVRTQIENVASNLHIEAFSAGGSADLTLAPGTNIQAAVVGSLLLKNEDATAAIALVSAATPAVEESSNWRSPDVPAVVVADDDQTTYIRVVLSAALASGQIRWHCHWSPLSDDGFVEAA